MAIPLSDNGRDFVELVMHSAVMHCHSAFHNGYYAHEQRTFLKAPAKHRRAAVLRAHEQHIDSCPKRQRAVVRECLELRARLRNLAV